MSFVRRVTSEPVVNLSVCWSDNFMTFPNASFLRSLPNLCDAIDPNAADSMPKHPPTATSPSIVSPVVIISAISCPITPSFTILAINIGCKRTKYTTPILVSC